VQAIEASFAAALAAGVKPISSRANLAAETVGINLIRYLYEQGREGSFKFMTAASYFAKYGTLLTVAVTNDPLKGIVVPPTTDVTGASGAWVRQFTGALDIRWFGGTPDCTAVGVGTDNAPALAAAATFGGVGAFVYIPKGKWRISSRPTFTKTIHLFGDSSSENSGIVNGVPYDAFTVYDGSVLVHDTSVGGPLCLDVTDVANASTVNFPTDYKYFSARNSTIRDIMLYGGGGTVTTAHGLEMRTYMMVTNVVIKYFAGNGVHIDASTSSNATPYGNADGAVLTNVKSRENKLHAFYTRGNDANCITFLNCDGALSGGVGFLDVSALGNRYIGCHAATNNQSLLVPGNYSAAQRTYVTSVVGGSAVQTGWAGLSILGQGSYVTTSATGAHIFSGCYVESGVGLLHEILSPSVIMGGNLSSTGTGTASATATVVSGAGAYTVANLNVQPGTGTTLTANHATFNLAPGSGTPQFNINPGSGTFSNFRMLGNGGSIALGCDRLAGGGTVYESADTHVMRNAAQSVTFNTVDNSGFQINTGVLKLGAVTVFNSGGVLQAAAVPAFAGGDVTSAGGSLILTLGNGAVTLAKLANLAATSLIGNATGAPATPTAITLAADHAFSGTTIQLGAFTGDITKAAGSLATTIANGVVTYAKMQNVTSARLLGNPTGGATAPSEVSLGADLAFSGTSLQVGAYTGDITKAAGSLATTIGASTVTLAKMANLAANSILGNNTGAGATPIALTGGQVTAMLSAVVSGGAQGAMSGQDKARLDANWTWYRSLLDCSGWLTAADAAGTYGLGQGDKAAISGTGTQYPLNSIYIAAADYPAIGTLNPKLRIRVQIHCNDVAPGVTFTVALHPITRPATSGGAGLCIYTIGAAVASSGIAIATPAADSSNTAVGAADIALPADGHYVLAVTTSGGALAASSHVHISAILQMRYA
jgi:hypothetical protein